MHREASFISRRVQRQRSPRRRLPGPCMCEDSPQMPEGAGEVDSLGERKVESPLRLKDDKFVAPDLSRIPITRVDEFLAGQGEGWRSFQLAGPSRLIYHRPEEVSIGIVTCGGLCPGTNDVVRAITLCASHMYGVKSVLGFRHGLRGLTQSDSSKTVSLTPELVGDIHTRGGTVLGTSRGQQSEEEMVDVCVTRNVSALLCVGGEGTLAAAEKICGEVRRRGAKISIVGVPKAIDNDLSFTDRTFGFDTAVEVAVQAVKAAASEARSREYGIGLVKLMGRHCGFLASHASIAASDAAVTMCLIPEVPVSVDDILARLRLRFEHRRHAVVIVTEGFGQDLLRESVKIDASGSVKLGDIGAFLRERLESFLKEEYKGGTVKYFDPTHMIRSSTCCNTPSDRVFSTCVAANAVHAAMSGFTNCFVGSLSDSFTLVPIRLALSQRKQVNPYGQLWRTVCEVMAEDASPSTLAKKQKSPDVAQHLSAMHTQLRERSREGAELRSSLKSLRARLPFLLVLAAAAGAVTAGVIVRWRSCR